MDTYDRFIHESLVVTGYAKDVLTMGMIIDEFLSWVGSSWDNHYNISISDLIGRLEDRFVKFNASNGYLNGVCIKEEGRVYDSV